MYASHICIMVVNYHKDMQMCKLSVRWFYLFLFFYAGNEDAPKRCYKCKKVGHLAKDCQERADGGANGTHEGNDMLNEADKIAMEEDDIKEIGEDEKEKLTDVDYLTGIPLPNDILLYAVPVCAPYAALQSYKYRVKIIPGTAKKGKGSFQISVDKL